MKKSIMIAKISGFMICHSASSCFEIVMKSPPKNTDRTPSMRKMSLASGEDIADIWLGKSLVFPLPKTSMPGRNFKLSGFGVLWVCMNIDLDWMIVGDFMVIWFCNILLWTIVDDIKHLKSENLEFFIDVSMHTNFISPISCYCCSHGTKVPS